MTHPPGSARYSDRASHRHARPNRWPTAFSAVALLLAASAALAGNDPSVTWLPLQPIHLQPGKQTVRVRLPRDLKGVVPQAVCLVGSAPRDAAATQPAQGISLTFTSGDRVLPAWFLRETPSGYLVNFETIDANPTRAQGELWIEIDYSGSLPVTITALGTPDFTSIDRSRDGPLDDIADASPSGPARDYADGLRMHMSGNLDAADAKYAAAAGGADEFIARIARRSRRVVAYQKRPPLPQTDFAAHRRSAAYLQQCGFFALAFGESGTIGGFDRSSSDSWYRLGELAERLNWPIGDVTQVFGRAGYAHSVDDPAYWHVLVVVLSEEEVETRDAQGGVSRKKITLTPEQVQAAYNNWFTVEQMILGASAGALEMQTDYLYVAGTNAITYELLGGRIWGPGDDLIPVRGAYDSVISIRPGGKNETVGADIGPNGAALSDIAADADWETMLIEWSKQFDWGANVCEIDLGFPPANDSADCGVKPLVSAGAARRSAFRYHATAGTFRKTLIGYPTEEVVFEVPATAPASEPGNAASSAPASAPAKVHIEPVGTEFVRRWRVEGPFDPAATANPDSSSGKHVLDRLPDASPRTVIVDGDDDFIDLSKVLGTTKPSLARTTCWVFSPQDQYAAMWLGHNDGMAVWVNGQCVHRGDYYATNRWADRNRTDMVMSHAILRRGWNRVVAVVEGWPAPNDKGWGFSLRFVDRVNKPMVGLAYRVFDPPEAERAPEWKAPLPGPYFNWSAAKVAWRDALPQLNGESLARHTGISGLTVMGTVRGEKGFVALGVPGEKPALPLRAMPAAGDMDWRFNNVLDWSHEQSCVYPYTKANQHRALLVLRPEAIAAYLDLLKESPDRLAVFGTRTLPERVLGWIAVPAEKSLRTMLVVDAALGDPKNWPIDEEDMLELPGPTPKKPVVKRTPASWPAIVPATASAPAIENR